MSKKYGKLLCILVSIFLIVGLLGGCAKDDPKDTTKPADPTSKEATVEPAEPTPEPEEIVLRIRSFMSGEDRLELMYQTIEAYHDRYPHVTLVYTTEEGAQFERNLRLTFSSGIGDEIIYMGDMTQQLLQRYDYILELTDIVEERGWVEKQFPGSVAFNNARTPGKYYGVPFLASTTAVFYNKDIFSELNLEPPKYLDEFIDILAKVKEAGYIPLETGGLQMYHQYYLVFHMLYGQVPQDEINKFYYLEETTPTFIEGFKFGLEQYDQWVEKGYFRDDVISIDYLNIPTLYAQGESAMVIDGNWRIGIMGDTGIPTGVFPFPPAKDSPQHLIIGPPHGNWGLNANLTPYEIKAAADFIDIFHEQEIIEKWVERGHATSVIMDYTNVNISPLATEFYRAVQGPGVSFFLDNTVPGFRDDVLLREFQRLTLREISVEECWNNIYKGHEELKADYLSR